MANEIYATAAATVYSLHVHGSTAVVYIISRFKSVVRRLESTIYAYLFVDFWSQQQQRSTSTVVVSGEWSTAANSSSLYSTTLHGNIMTI